MAKCENNSIGTDWYEKEFIRSPALEVNDIAINSLQAQDRILSDNDKVVIVPLLDGG